MAGLLDLCSEVLHNILLHVLPADLAALSSTCKELHTYIRHDRILFKELYLRHWDYPLLPDSKLSDGTWQERLQDVVSTAKILESKDTSLKVRELSKVSKTVRRLLQIDGSTLVRSKNIAFLAERFDDEKNVKALLCQSKVFQDLNSGHKEADPPPPDGCRMESARLSCLRGHDFDQRPPMPRRLHEYARAIVYDLRFYTQENLWGPFLSDGSLSVDWEKVQAIMIDLDHNMRDLNHRIRPKPHIGPVYSSWDGAFAGAMPQSFISPAHTPKQDSPMEKEQSPEDILIAELAAKDPYGVTGTWARVVCFLDYTDFYSYNFNRPDLPLSEPGQPISTREATRFIILNLHVTRIEEPGEGDGKDLPVVHFEGVARAMFHAWDPNANSSIKGTVRLTPAGEVRWTSISAFHGEERWSSEGVQIGGLKSARGVVGTWFDKDFDERGPAGPTAFWKLSDEIKPVIDAEDEDAWDSD